MHPFPKYLLAALGVAILSGVVWLTPAGPGLAQATKVTLAEVVNAPDRPIPTAAQGTTRVEGAVAVSNTPTVAIAGTPAVEIESSDRDPVIVRHSGDCSPFHIELFFQVDEGASNGTETFFVPTDKRLVIEQVTIKVTAPPTGFAQASIRNTVNGVTITPDLIMVSMGVFGADTKILQASQNVRWYADPGTEVGVSATKSFAELANVYATISGYLVDCARERTP